MTTALTARQPEQTWGESDVQLIKDTVSKGATDAEFKLLLYLANKYNLDPLARQIWLIKYGNNPASIYAGRDGFLKIAHDSGQFDGMDSFELYDDKGNVIGAECTVWRKDMTHPFRVRVTLKEYDTKQNQWAAKPGTMIKKVAESQCLRKAFPISGLYSPEEIAETPSPAPSSRQSEVVDTATGEVVEVQAKELATAVSEGTFAPKPKPVQHRKLSDEEMFERGRVAKYLWELTELETVPKGGSQFAPITLDQFNIALRKMTGCTDATSAAAKYGLAGVWQDEVKARYSGEGLRMGQMFSAVLHIMWEKEAECREKEESQKQGDLSSEKAATPDPQAEWDALASAGDRF